MRARWDLEDVEDIPLKDFDDTLTSGIDDTISHLKIEGFISKAEQSQLQLTALEELRSEIKKLREEHAEVVQTVNRKASKSALALFEKTLGAKNDKRIDNLFKLVTFLGVAIGLIVAVVKGH